MCSRQLAAQSVSLFGHLIPSQLSANYAICHQLVVPTMNHLVSAVRVCSSVCECAGATIELRAIEMVTYLCKGKWINQWQSMAVSAIGVIAMSSSRGNGGSLSIKDHITHTHTWRIVHRSITTFPIDQRQAASGPICGRAKLQQMASRIKKDRRVMQNQRVSHHTNRHVDTCVNGSRTHCINENMQILHMQGAQ